MLALFIAASLAMPIVNAQEAPPTTVAGTVTVNGVATNGVSVSGGGGSDTTHDGGKYTFSVTPDKPITITATYQGHSASATVTVKSGDMMVKDLSINYQIATPTPTASPTVKPSATVAPTKKPTTVPPPATPKPAVPVVVTTGTPTPTPIPTPVPTAVQDNSTAAVTWPSTEPVINNSTVSAKLSDNLTNVSAMSMERTSSPGFSLVLLLVALTSVVYLLGRRQKSRK